MRFTPAAAARWSRELASDAVVYLSNFENHPAAVATVSRGRALWGNPPAVLRDVRDPFAVAAALRARGIPVPQLRANDPNVPNDPNDPNAPLHWLLKPRLSGGGHGVRPWRPGARMKRGTYLQERIDGLPAAIVFVAAGGRMSPLGVSLQIVGDAAFGASQYRYCGSLMGPAPLLFGTSAVLERAIAVAAAVADEFGLVGVNGVDFIARGNQAWPIEVNPRWSSSMELVERLTGRSVFAAHAAACVGGDLPAGSASRDPAYGPSRDPAYGPSRDPAYGPVAGKAIVYARVTSVMGDTRAWLLDSNIRDVPHGGERIERGQPICTVFAEADDAAACRAALTRAAERIYCDVERWRREAA
jgi:predicted ATP-grasp superfamily ATP-dependent carboligase